jgi:hypothetical protein
MSFMGVVDMTTNIRLEAQAKSGARLTSSPNPSAPVRTVFSRLAARGYLLALALAVAPVARAEQQTYPTIETAARAALTSAFECGREDYECGGVIYQHPDGRFSFTAPITDHRKFGVMIPYLYSVPPAPGFKVAADYHTHICNEHNYLFAPFFSASDADVNEGFHIRGFMLDGCSGNIHLYDPSQDPRDDEVVTFKPHADGTRHAPFYLTIGHVVGWLDLADLLA